MRSRRERRGERRRGGIKPVLLAAGLALIWFAEFQDDAVPVGVPNWVVALVFGSRLLADIVGALVIISVLRLVLIVVRLLVVRWRLQRQLEVR